jgi:hypothetical protein
MRGNMNPKIGQHIRWIDKKSGYSAHGIVIQLYKSIFGNEKVIVKGWFSNKKEVITLDQITDIFYE